MKLYGTRIATQMWRRRDHFDACVYGNIHDCTVECKYFVQGDEAWRDDGNKDTVTFIPRMIMWISLNRNCKTNSSMRRNRLT